MHVDVSEVLDKIIKGGRPSKSDLEVVGEAAAGLRQDFIYDAFQAIGRLTPHTVEFEGFKNCLKSMTDYLMKHGFVTIQEIQVLWLKIQEAEK